ncbi:MAG: class I SAM-dependent methyltransferase [Thiotrichaceae bacterium]|nr:class I SAM-dependent methyltransferase [Thiotrichaceae bacterium]PCI12802.1 MAG: SAM-dependent methyltransferase [Thiotrichales bacterium]
MQRIPEADLMDDGAQAKAYAEADFSEPHENFIALFKQQWPGWDVIGRVLDLGCGTADISIRFARAFAGCEIEGVDGADEMLAYGIRAVAAAGLSKRIDLRNVYLPDETLEQPLFDAVISNSLLHHLKEPMTLWQTISFCAKQNTDAGTPVFVMDLMRPDNQAEVLRLVERYVASEPEVLRHDFHHSLYAAYRVDEVRAQLDAAGLHQLTVQAVSDRHLVVAGLL